MILTEMAGDAGGKDDAKLIPVLIRYVTGTMANMLIAKNQSYGGSIFDPPLLCPEMNPKTVIDTRIGDKIARLISLRQKGLDAAFTESFSDTLDDIVGYIVLRKCLLWAESQRGSLESIRNSADWQTRCYREDSEFLASILKGWDDDDSRDQEENHSNVQTSEHADKKSENVRSDSSGPDAGGHWPTSRN